MPTSNHCDLPRIGKRKRKTPAYVVLEQLSLIPEEQRSKTKVLDIPSGDGVILIPLSMAGFDTIGCDIFPEYVNAGLTSCGSGSDPDGLRGFWRSTPPCLIRELLYRNSQPIVKKISVVEGDMQNRLPFKDGAFDIIISVEGIEHIDTQEYFIQELRRVLKPGGRLILSTPNILSIRSRLSYALTGQGILKTFIDEYTSVQNRDGNRIYHGHVFLISYFQLHYLLHNSGFQISGLLPSRYSTISLMLTPFMLPLIGLFTFDGQRKAKQIFEKVRRARENSETPASPFSQITRHVLSPAILWGKNLILEAKAL